MRRLLITLMLTGAFLTYGCGNKIDLPQEGDSGEIPFKNYFVYATWTNLGAITDILVTRAQWVYMAEDSATVKRYRAKGGTGETAPVSRKRARHWAGSNGPSSSTRVPTIGSGCST